KGALREVDLSRHSCQLFPVRGRAIPCKFEDHLEPDVRAALGRYVVASGKAKRREGEEQIEEMDLETIEGKGAAEVTPAKPKSAKELLRSLRESGVVGMWKDRDDIRDSSEFADRLRGRVQEEPED